MNISNLLRAINHFYAVAIVIAFICLVGTPALADEDEEVINLYDQFNVQLNQLNLTEPMILITNEEILKAKRMLDRIDISVLRKFYTKAMNETNNRCYSNSMCRFSGLVFIASIVMSKYEVIDLKKINEESIELVIWGETTAGLNIDLILSWLLEDGQWKIDSIVSK